MFFTSAAVFATALAFAALAGPLDPPAGPVAPTMKTLAQAEPRTPIESLPFTISQPGSYYLARNLTATADGNGITIAAPRVTLDLAGFTLLGGGFQGVAITGTANGNVTVRNGVITDWTLGGVVLASAPGSAFQDLIVATSSASAAGNPGIQGPQSCRVQRCTVTGHAVGIRVARGSQISDCAVASCLTDGILAQGSGVSIRGCTLDVNGTAAGHAQINAVNAQGICISHCSINTSNGPDGIRTGSGAAISNCSAALFAGGTAIRTDAGSSVTDCAVTVNAGAANVGILVGEGGRAANCTVRLATAEGTGILSLSFATITGCNVTGGQIGISVVSASSTVEDNRVQNAVTGIAVVGGGHFIARNRVYGGTQYNIQSGHRFGPIIDATNAGDLSLVPGANHPLANFKY